MSTTNYLFGLLPRYRFPAQRPSFLAIGVFSPNVVV
jgi:hypothetical protein